MKPRYDKTLKLRMPASLARLVEETAARQCRSPPDFIRAAILRSLAMAGAKYNPQQPHQEPAHVA